VEGRGSVRVGEREFDVAPRDVFVIPGWVPYTLHAEENLVLFSYSDRAAQEKLGFLRVQRL
jgi:gentisate 1,2-dioxygenase